MNELLHFLQNRNSAPRLCEPAPSAEELQEIIRAAIRAPDHAWLHPWRFLSISGQRRSALGDILESSLKRRQPQADAAARLKARNAPLRAPLIVVVIASLAEHPKVPAVEQRLSAGCAAHAILLAVEALGYAGVWRTGEPAFDRTVMTGLGLAQNEEITGFLYLGSRDGQTKVIPELNTDRFLTEW